MTQDFCITLIATAVLAISILALGFFIHEAARHFWR